MSTPNHPEDTVLRGSAAVEPVLETLLARSIELAEANVDAGQLPFGALVVRGGTVLAEEVNTALRDDDPTAHAEVAAVRAACRALGVLALPGAIVVSSCRPCPMCEAVALIAGIDEIVYAAPAEAAASAGLVLSPAAAAVQEQLAASGLGISRLVEVPQATRPFERYRAWLDGAGGYVARDPVVAAGASVGEAGDAPAGGPSPEPRPAEAAWPVGPVTELRVALTVPDYERALAFYRDALGLPVVESWATEEGSGSVLAAGRATLEVISTDQADLIDRVEVGRRVAGPVRLALEVADSAATADALVEAGAERVAEPVVTPWNHRNARVAAPDGMQLTLFTALPDDRDEV